MRLHWPSFFLSAGCFRAEVYSCGYALCIGNEAQIEGVDKSGRAIVHTWSSTDIRAFVVLLTMNKNRSLMGMKCTTSTELSVWFFFFLKHHHSVPHSVSASWGITSPEIWLTSQSGCSWWKRKIHHMVAIISFRLGWEEKTNNEKRLWKRRVRMKGGTEWHEWMSKLWETKKSFNLFPTITQPVTIAHHWPYILPISQRNPIPKPLLCFQKLGFSSL